MGLDEQPIDDNEVVPSQEVHGQVVHEPIIKTNMIHVDDDVADEVAETDAHVVDEVAATYLVPTTTVDTEVTNPASIESSTHTDREFSGGSID